MAVQPIIHTAPTDEDTPPNGPPTQRNEEPKTKPENTPAARPVAADASMVRPSSTPTIKGKNDVLALQARFSGMFSLSKSKPTMQNSSMSTSLRSSQLRSKNCAKESVGTVSTSTETISLSNFSCPIHREQQTARKHGDEQDLDVLKNLPPPNTLPRRVLVQRARSVETSVFGISTNLSEASSITSNQNEGDSVDFNSLVATASTKQLANNLDFRHTDTSSSSNSPRFQNEKNSKTQGPEIRRKRAKILLSKFFRACTANPLTHLDGNFFTEDYE